MPRGIGYHDLTPYLKELLDQITNLPYEYLSQEIKDLLNKIPTEITFEQLSPELQALVKTAENIGYDNLDPYLQSKIDDIGKIDAGEELVYISNNNIYKGYREVREDGDEVNFIVGEIKEYTMFKDTLNVYLNSVRMTEGIDYAVNDDCVSIRCLKQGGWPLNSNADKSHETVNLFEFELHKNTTLQLAGEGAITTDHLAEDSVTLEKINDEVWKKIQEIAPRTAIISDYSIITQGTFIETSYRIGKIPKLDESCVMRVHVNSIKLIEGLDYVLNKEKETIVFSSEYTATEEYPVYLDIEVIANVLTSYSPSDDSELDEADIDTLRQEVKSLKKQVTQMSSTQSNADAKLFVLEAEMGDVEDFMETTDNRLTTLEVATSWDFLDEI